MKTLVNNIFATNDVKASVLAYLKLLQAVEAQAIENPSSEFTSAVLLLEKSGNISISNIYGRNDALLQAYDGFRGALASVSREHLLLSYLAMVICCYYVGDKKAAEAIQSIISSLTFEASFWEKNGNDIKKIAMCVGGAALVVATGGSAILGAGVGVSAYKIFDKDLPSMSARITCFNEIKDAILSIKFV